MKKKCFSLIVMLVIVLGLLPTSALAATSNFGGGSGTVNDPYRIVTVTHLHELALKVNSGTSYEDAYFKLENDIDLGNTRWLSIGDSKTGRSFDGYFDGDYHTISSAPLIKNSQGLFGYNAGAIVNLYISGTVEESKMDSTSIGGVVGLNAGGLYNCHFEGTVSGNENVGGITGRNQGDVIGCYNSGTVYGRSNVGGVIGLNDGGDVLNCKNYSSIFCTCENGTCVGGIIGKSESRDQNTSIKNCFNSGFVSANGAGYVGGMIGRVSGATIQDMSCINTVLGNHHVGGIIGDSAYVSLKNCDNLASVSGVSYVGGIIGEAFSSTLENCNNYDPVKGNKFVDGLIGSASHCTQTNCKSLAQPIISGTGNLGTDANYNGPEVLLTNALYTFTASNDGYKVSAKTSNGKTVSLCLRVGQAGYPQTTDSTGIITLTKNSDDTFHIKSSSNNYIGYLYFWHDISRLYFDQSTIISSDNGNKFLLYSLASSTETSSTEVPGYVRVSNINEIISGKQYLIVANANNNYYALYPSDDETLKYSHVIKINS